MKLQAFPSRTILRLILLLAVTLRLLFIFIGAKWYYTESVFLNGDSFSYIQSFINLWNKGVFSFDLTHPDAAFGRLPGYPFFWGFHYLLFPEEMVPYAVAVSQMVMELIAITAMYHTMRYLTSTRLGLWAAFLYAVNPFNIVWITVIGTESLATSLTVIFFYVLLVYRKGVSQVVLSALLAGLAFYVREYLGILLVAAFIGFWVRYQEATSLKVKYIFLAGTIFGAMYVIWPLRNYISYNRIILIKTASSGYHAFDDDVVEMRKWLYSWTPDAEIILNQILKQESGIVLPDEIFANKDEKAIAEDAIEKAKSCSRGFYYFRNYKRMVEEKDDCTQQVAQNVKALRASFIKRAPVWYWTRTPVSNFKKAFFKSELQTKKASMKDYFQQVLFTGRSIYMILGVVGLVLLCYTKPETLSVGFFFVFMLFFICVIVRQLEMRYLLQAETMLLPFAAYSINRFLNWLTRLISM